MKKFFAMMLTIAMLLTAVAAFAEGGRQGGPQMGGPKMGQMQGGNSERQTPPEKPSGRNIADAPEKPDAAPEKPTGEKPADAPAEPEDLTGEKPADMPEKPADDQAPANGQTPPEKPSDNQRTADGQTPAEGQQAPTDGQAPQGQGPKMIDFDAMVTRGIISQETRDAIKAYMDEHKPADMPADGQTPPEKPADGQTSPEKPADGQAPEDAENGLLNDLLNAGIITQAEYDAMMAA